VAPLLHLVRPLAAIDCEATGPQQDTDRAIEVAVVIMQPDGTRTSLRWRINPGRPIPAESTAVHHITDADVADAPPFEAVAAEILDALSGVDITGYNLRAFDIPLLRAEFARCGITWAPSGHVADSYIVFRERERHTLSTAVRWYCGRELVDAHSAVADAEGALDVLLAQLERYPDLPRDLAALDVASGGRRPDWATELGHLRWRPDGDLYVAWGRHDGAKLINMDDGFLRWVLRSDFPADVQAFVHDVRRGGHPRAPGAPALPPAPPESDDPDDHWGGDDDCDEDPGVPAPAAMPTPSAPRAPFAPPVPPTDDDHNDDIPF